MGEAPADALVPKLMNTYVSRRADEDIEVKRAEFSAVTVARKSFPLFSKKKGGKGGVAAPAP